MRKERFALLPALDFLFEPERVRNGLGVYVLLLKNADGLLLRAGLHDVADMRQWSIQGHQHVYTGMSTAVRSRLLWHLCGNIWNSSVREALLSIQFTDTALWEERPFDLDDWEKRLTTWFEDNIIVGYRIADDAAELEASLIGRYPSPFNTAGNRRSSLVAALGKKRELLRGHLAARGKVALPANMTPAQWLLSPKSHREGELQRHVTDFLASRLRSAL